MRKTLLQLGYAAVLSMLVFAAPLGAQKQSDTAKITNPSLPAVIWHDPGDISSLDLLSGAGGKDRAPDPHGRYQFVKEDMDGSNPKFDVKDDQGNEWKVKLGEESQSETAAARLLWAMGYFVDEDYYFAEFKVEGLPKLHRGESFVSKEGTVRSVRLERRIKEMKKLDTWDWFENPFVGTQEFDGLRVMMALVNNWDLKVVNNWIYETDGQLKYMVSDLGATLGNTGAVTSRSKSNPKDFEKARFVKIVAPDYVDFVMNTRPGFITAVAVNNYRKRSEMEKVVQHIPRSHARWIGDQLAKLSSSQINDAFRSAGYTPEQIEEYTKAILDRIEELENSSLTDAVNISDGDTTHRENQWNEALT